MSLYDIPLRTLGGEETTLAAHKDSAALVVNVASRCGLTPQYAGLEALHEELAGRGFTVLGFPCNQFLGQEPGTSEEIAEFCSTTYGVTFPMFEKLEVNGADQHPLYAELKARSGDDADIKWNFEKFVVAPGGEQVQRFGPQTEPDDPALRAAIEAVLPD